MATVMEDLCQHVLTGTNGLTFGTNLIAGVLPDKPDNCVALLDYSGPAPGFVMGSKSPTFNHPRVQVLVRSDDATGQIAGRNLIEAIARALEQAGNTVVNGTLYRDIARIQDPFMLHRDNSRRWFFACNFDIDKDLG